MNKVILMGRLVQDPKINYTTGAKPTCIARFTLAVDKRFKKEGGPTADFISIVAMGHNGEFSERYLKKGMKIAVTGSIQTGSYTNKEGQKVYTTDVVAGEFEFCESKSSSSASSGNYNNNSMMTAPQQNTSNYRQNNARNQAPMPQDANAFVTIPEGIEEELPFM